MRVAGSVRKIATQVSASEIDKGSYKDTLNTAVRHRRLDFIDSNFNTKLKEKAFDLMKLKKSSGTLPLLKHVDLSHTKSQAELTMDVQFESNPVYSSSQLQAVDSVRSRKDQSRKGIQGLLSHHSGPSDAFSSRLEDMARHQSSKLTLKIAAEVSEDQDPQPGFKVKPHPLTLAISNKKPEPLQPQPDKPKPPQSSFDRQFFSTFKTPSLKEEVQVKGLRKLPKYVSKDIKYDGRFVYPFPPYSLKLPKRLRIKQENYNDFYCRKGLDTKKYLKSIFFAVKSLCRLFIVVKLRRERLLEEERQRLEEEERKRLEAERLRLEEERRKREEEEEYERWLKANKKTRKYVKKSQDANGIQVVTEGSANTETDNASEAVRELLNGGGNISDGLYDASYLIKDSVQQQDEHGDEEGNAQEEASHRSSNESDQSLREPDANPGTKAYYQQPVRESRRLLIKLKDEKSNQPRSSKKSKNDKSQGSDSSSSAKKKQKLNPNQYYDNVEQDFIENSIKEKQLQELIQDQYLPFLHSKKTDQFELAGNFAFERKLVDLDARMNEAIQSATSTAPYSSRWMKIIDSQSELPDSMKSQEPIGYYSFLGVQPAEDLTQAPLQNFPEHEEAFEAAADFFQLFFKLSQDIRLDELAIPNLHSYSPTQTEDHYFTEEAVSWELEWFRREYGPHGGRNGTQLRSSTQEFA